MGKQAALDFDRLRSRRRLALRYRRRRNSIAFDPLKVAAPVVPADITGGGTLYSGFGATFAGAQSYNDTFVGYL
jgi:hypothetical protein